MTLSNLVKSLESELSGFNRVRMIRGHATTLRRVLVFTGEEPSPGEVFDPTWLFRFQCHLYSKGLKRNTVSFYMRMLRSIYNKSVDAGLLVNIPRLFFHVYTGLATTIKRSLPPHLIHKLIHSKVSASLEFCRDLFVLCFRLQGMTFVDLAYLKKLDIQGNVITYIRRKSGSQITVYIDKEAQKILDKYKHLTKGSEYAFPIITDMQKDPRLQHESALHTQNKRLKRLATELKLDVNLTTYVARHSWATMAYHNGVPTPLIKEALGHGKEEITRIYLAGFTIERFSEANEIVSRAVEEAGKIQDEKLKKEREEEEEKKRCPSPGK